MNEKKSEKPKSKDLNNSVLEQLRKDVQKKSWVEGQKRPDFDQLVTDTNLSLSTIKRFLGYEASSNGFNGTTLNILCAYVLGEGKTLKDYENHLSDLNDITKEEIPQFNNEYNRNGLKAKYINLYGTGNYVFKKENVRCVFDRQELVLPEDLENIRIGIELTQIELAKKAKKEHWNSDLLGLKSFVRGRTDDEKNLSLNLIFYLSNYYRNLATGGSLSTKVFDDISGNFVTVRQKYLDHAYWEEVVPILAAAFGVALSVITNDNYLLVAKRASTGMGSWRGHYHCAMNEGLNGEDFVDGEPDLFETARRGLKEELGITDNEVLDLRFLTFGYDTINYQWGLHGMVKVNLTAQEVMDNAPSKSVDRWEYEKLFTIKFNVRDVIRFIIDNDPWTPFCKVCIIYTLIQCFGEEAVDREIDWQLKLKTM